VDHTARKSTVPAETMPERSLSAGAARMDVRWRYRVRVLTIRGGIMSRRLIFILAATAAGATAGLVFLLVFLLRQGLGKASMWATFLVLPLTVIIAVAGVWATVVAAHGSSEGRGEAPDHSLEKMPVRPSVVRSGDIRQEHTAGPSIAHTGAGDIIFARPEAVESPDEPA